MGFFVMKNDAGLSRNIVYEYMVAFEIQTKAVNSFLATQVSYVGFCATDILGSNSQSNCSRITLATESIQVIIQTNNGSFLPLWTIFSGKILTHYGLLTPHDGMNLGQYWVSGGFKPDDTKPLPEPMLTHH